MSNKNYISTIVIAVLLIVLLVGLTACGKPAPTSKNTSSSVSQCKTDNDCLTLLNKTLKKCMSAYCGAGRCKTQISQNCCGNNISEEIENGLPGNKCTCPQDYGTCNSTVKYGDSTAKLVAAKYIQKSCLDNQCQTIYDDLSQRNIEFFTAWPSSGFSMNIYINYPNLFYKDNSTMEIELKLTDYDPEKISGPIVINEIRLMESSKILSKINPGIALIDIGQSAKNDITMTGYDFVYPEEYKTVVLNFDYEYVPLQKTTVNGVAKYKELPIERKSYTVALKDKITFLDKSLITN